MLQVDPMMLDQREQLGALPTAVGRLPTAEVIVRRRWSVRVNLAIVLGVFAELSMTLAGEGPGGEHVWRMGD